MSSSTQGLESSRRVVRATRRYRAWIVALVLFLAGFVLMVMPHALQPLGVVSEVTRELGVVVLTTGLVSFIYEFALRHSFVQEVEALLRSHSELGDQGLIGIRAQLRVDTVNARFAKARREIIILQTWIGNLIPIREAIICASEQGCSIKILLLSPESPHAAFRSVEYGNDKDYVSQQVRANLADLRAIRGRLRLNNVEIRLYDGTPIFTVYAADGDLFVGFYWRHLGATEGPQLEIRAESLLGQRVRLHFEDLWRNAAALRLADETLVA